jgi:hypothetical protein
MTPQSCTADTGVDDTSGTLGGGGMTGDTAGRDIGTTADIGGTGRPANTR